MPWRPAFILALTLAACGEEPSAPSSCPDGTLRDGDGRCLPEDCGADTWGQWGEADDAVWVLAGAEGGDGSQEAPLASIQEALDLAAGQGLERVIVGEGVYPERLEVRDPHDDLELLGRCRALTTLDASAEDEYGALSVQLGSPGQEFYASDLTIRGGNFGVDGLLGQLELERVDVVESRAGGLYVKTGAGVTLREVSIRGTVETEPGSGAGVQMDGGALDASDSTFSANCGVGVLILGGRANLDHSEVSANLPDSHGYFGRGVEIHAGSLSGEDLRVIDNTDIGLSVLGGTVNLQGALLAGTLSNGDGAFGRGLDARAGEVTLTDSVIESNHDTGALISDATLTLTRVTVRDTQPDGAGRFGIGLQLEGAVATLEDVQIEGNGFTGLLATSSAITATDLMILNTHLDGDGVYGRGMDLSDRCTMDADGVQIADNHDAGLIAKDSTLRLTDLTITGTREGAASASGVGIYLERADLSVQGGRVEDNVTAGLAAIASRLDLSDVELRDTAPDRALLQGTGIELWEGSEAYLQSVQIDGAFNHGLSASDASTVTMQDVSIRGVSRTGDLINGFGLAVQLGASVQATDLDVSGVDGPGLYVVDGELTCAGCVLSDNRFAGAVLQYGGTLRLAESTIEGNLPQTNEGGGFGVWCNGLEFPSSLEVVDTAIGPHALAGLWFEGAGPLRLSGTTLLGDPSAAPRSTRPSQDGLVILEAADVTLEGNRLSGWSGEAVLLHHATASFAGNTFSDNTLDVLKQRCEPGESPLDLSLESPLNLRECPEYDVTISDIDFALYAFEPVVQ